LVINAAAYIHRNLDCFRRNARTHTLNISTDDELADLGRCALLGEYAESTS